MNKKPVFTHMSNPNAKDFLTTPMAAGIPKGKAKNSKRPKTTQKRMGRSAK